MTQTTQINEIKEQNFFLINGRIVPAVYEIKRTSNSENVTIKNVFTQEYLIVNEPLENISINNTVYTSFEAFNFALAPIIYKINNSASNGNNNSNSFWGLSGNEGIQENNFIGTTDNMPLVFKVNNLERFSITDKYLNFGADQPYNDGTKWLSFHNEKNANPIVRISSIIDSTDPDNKKYAEFQFIHATRDKWAHKLSKKGDLQILSSGSNRIIIGSRTNVEAPEEIVDIVLAPASSAGTPPLTARSLVGNIPATGINNLNPTDKLDIIGGTNDSGVTLRSLTGETPTTRGSRPLGVKDGKVVIFENETYSSNDFPLNSSVIAESLFIQKVDNIVFIHVEVNINADNFTGGKSLSIFSLKEELTPSRVFSNTKAIKGENNTLVLLNYKVDNTSKAFVLDCSDSVVNQSVTLEISYKLN